MLKFLLIFLTITFSVPAHANFIDKHVPKAQKIGNGRLSVALWDVYDATLFASGEKWSNALPFALKINYLREIEGSDIAERSIDEMIKIGNSDKSQQTKWLSEMKRIFPDVKSGTSITGVYIPSSETIFYFNDKQIGKISDPQFGKWFFNIWLSENTSEPELRKQLLGIK